MKKLAILLTGLIIVLVACSEQNGDAAQFDQESDSLTENEISIETEQQLENDDIQKETVDSLTSLLEYPILEEKVDLSKYQAEVKEDRPNKRIILLSDGDGQKAYKSILIKKTNRLKIIQFDHGEIFNDVI